MMSMMRMARTHPWTGKHRSVMPDECEMQWKIKRRKEGLGGPYPMIQEP